MWFLFGSSDNLGVKKTKGKKGNQIKIFYYFVFSERFSKHTN